MREIQILSDTIELPLAEKRRKLKKTIANYMDGNILKIKTFRSTFKILKQLQNENNIFYRKDLVEKLKQKCKWAEERADYHLNKMASNNIIEKVEPGKYVLKYYGEPSNYNGYEEENTDSRCRGKRQALAL
jgi:hypothetical protein